MDNNQWTPPAPPAPFPTGKKELLFALAMAGTALLLTNSILYGGFNLGFSVSVVLSIALSVSYLLVSGAKPNAYGLTILGLCTVIGAGFARSDDFFVKFVLFQFLFLGINLGLCLLVGKNRFPTHRFHTLGDSFVTFFDLGLGKISPAFRGLGGMFRNGSRFSRSFGSVILGICIAFPVLLIVIPLLIQADAAFDGLVSLLPKFDLEEFLGTLLCGGMLFTVLYTRGTGLINTEPKERIAQKEARGLPLLTVNTVLGTVCAVYLAYLISQLAYFSGGFSGLLPKGYTLAEYARRGFFEMAALCAVNLGIISICLAVVKKETTAPLSLRYLCLFLGLVTLFLVCAASAKMFLYIDKLGLTRLRLLTQIVMLFLSATTIIIMVWLFVPKLPYMKAVILTALIIGALVIWLDVDTIVATYNVNAYLSGKLKNIDLDYLSSLGNGAIPQIARLGRETTSTELAKAVKNCLARQHISQDDLRSWNWVTATAKSIIKK